MSELVQPQQLVPENTAMEAVVLEVLHRPSRQAFSLKEIARELIHRYDVTDVERCLLALQEKELVELSYTSGYGLGFRATLLNRR